MKINNKPEWEEALKKCAEKLVIIDEETKCLLWSNEADAPKERQPGEKCYKALFGRDKPCPACPELRVGEMYQWDYYNADDNGWLKVKSLLFYDGERLLRAGNLNAMDDAMNLSRDSVEQISEMMRLLNENSRIKSEIEYEASHDRMTGLLNRNRFNTDISSGIFDKGGTGVLYFDLNNLKRVNDELRHEAGDRIIKALADTVARTEGETKNAFAYRIGGDEFVMLIKNCTRTALDEAKFAFRRHLDAQTCDPPCIAAVGEAFCESDCDAEALVNTADSMMYAEKRQMKALEAEGNR